MLRVYSFVHGTIQKSDNSLKGYEWAKQKNKGLKRICVGPAVEIILAKSLIPSR